MSDLSGGLGHAEAGPDCSRTPESRSGYPLAQFCCHRSTLVSASIRGSYVYPHWQFDPETGEGLEDLPRLLGSAEEAGVGPLALDGFMVSESGGEDGVPPYRMFRSGPEGRELVLGAIGAAISEGS